MAIQLKIDSRTFEGLLCEQVALVVGMREHGVAVALSNLLVFKTKDQPLFAKSFITDEQERAVQAVQELIEERSNRLLGGIHIIGLHLSFTESEKSLVLQGLKLLNSSLEDNIGGQIYLYNPGKKSSYLYTSSVNSLDEIKFNESICDIVEVSMQLNRSFVLELYDNQPEEIDIHATVMVKDYLCKSYFKSQDKIFRFGSSTSASSSPDSNICEFTLLKNSNTSMMLRGEIEKGGAVLMKLHLNMKLIGYVSNKGSIQDCLEVKLTLMKVLLEDYQRSFTERRFINLDHGFSNLPKRCTLLRSSGQIIRDLVYILPEENVDEVLKSCCNNFDAVQLDKTEGTFGETCQKISEFNQGQEIENSKQKFLDEQGPLKTEEASEKEDISFEQKKKIFFGIIGAFVLFRLLLKLIY